MPISHFVVNYTCFYIALKCPRGPLVSPCMKACFWPTFWPSFLVFFLKKIIYLFFYWGGCQKLPYQILTQSFSALFESVEYVDVLQDFNSNTQHKWPWMQYICYILIINVKYRYEIRFQTHKYIEHEFWTWWGLCRLCIWPYLETMSPLRVEDYGLVNIVYPQH